MLEKWLIEVLNMSLTASVVILAVILARWLLRKTPRIFSYALWAAVLFRLLCPISFTADISLLGILRSEPANQGRMEYITEDIGYAAEPAVNLPVPAANDLVNDFLPPANPEGSVNPMQILLYLGAWIWLLGILGMGIYSLISILRLRGRLKMAVWEKDNIYQIPGEGTPFVAGILHPRIYLPEGLCEEEKRYMLLHEQIHIKRKDHVFRLLAYLALCLHWFNPLVWLAFFLSGRDMEMSCDEAVIQKTGNGVKKEYSASLLALAARSHGIKGMPIAFGEGDTKSRIKNVLRYQKPGPLFLGIAAVICCVLAVLFLANPGKDASFGETVFYGVTGYADLEGTQQMVVTIPGLGDLTIPEAEEITPYIEIDFDGLEAGDLIRMTFRLPKGQELSIEETYPARFSQKAERIEVMGRGPFALEQVEEDRYRFCVPLGMAKEAQSGDTLEIYHHDPEIDGKERELLTSVTVLEVRQEEYQIFVELSAKEAETFLSEFGFGVSCELIKQEDGKTASETGASIEGSSEEESLAMESALEGNAAKTEGESAERFQELTPEHLQGEMIPDGRYRVYLQSISASARGIDRYAVNFWDEEADGELPFLAFADACVYQVNHSMIRKSEYGEISFEEFAELVRKGADYGNQACDLTFADGLITQAALKSEWYAYGITYEEFVRDTWYRDIQEITGLSEEKVLKEYYTLKDSLEADIGDGQGVEKIEIYTGNIGDGDSGLVLFKAADGTLLYSEGAHAARAGWNNLYLGEGQNGVPFLLRVRIEDRDTYGEYRYDVFRLGAKGEIFQFQGSSFTFDDGRIPYDDGVFREWMGNLTYFLEKSQLLLSTQEGEIRTERVSEAEKYSYETLRREK